CLAIGFQVLRHTANAGDGIANFVGDPGRQSTDGSQPLTMYQVFFQSMGFSQVFQQDDLTILLVGIAVGDVGFMQVDPSRFALQCDALFIKMACVSFEEIQQYSAPGFWQSTQFGAEYLV